MKQRIVWISIALFAALLLAAGLLLRADFLPFLRWYIAIFLLGLGFYPLAARLFDGFSDHGWIFSKTIALAVCGYASWLFVTTGLQGFTSRRCLVITLIAFGICWVRHIDSPHRVKPDLKLILLEEGLFFGILLFWTYCIAFRPEASGTEKFMDYGFLVSMERSIEMPPKDIWYGMAGINYYYGGQYFAAYLSKLCYLPSRLTYNLMRAVVGAFAFTMPFSIVYHMIISRMKEHEQKQGLAVFGGLLAGAAVALAGNVHYVLYGLLGPYLRLPGYEDYWFPSSTRYIGHNPVVEADQCIHEFPSYSVVLGDLHAHMVNIIFVLTITALLYSWVRQVRMQELDRLELERIQEEQQRRRPSKFESQKSWKLFFTRNGFEVQLLFASCLIGLSKWTNYWDYIIYFTVALFVIIMVALYRYRNNRKRMLASVALHTFQLWLISMLIPLPFMLQFDPPNAGVGIAVYHSKFYQLAVLWGLPVLTGIALLVASLVHYHDVYKTVPEKERKGRIADFFRYVPQADRFALVLALSAFGLVLIPELFYVKDIYSDGYSRANTMFKLTYQASILFGIVMSYALIRLLAIGEKLLSRLVGIALLAVFVMTLGYFPYSVSCWFGNIADRDRYQGIDATAFIADEYPEDAGAIEWLHTYVKGQPLVLEASGDSYSEYCRVSAMTGLPTLEGWYVHEWLWRGDTKDLNAKNDDIRNIFEATELNDAEVLLKRYGISYVFVGSCEHEKYIIQDEVLRSLGDVVYEEGPTYIVKLQSAE